MTKGLRKRIAINTMPAIQEVKDETVLNPKGNGNPSLGSASQKQADDGDYAPSAEEIAEWESWCSHSHDLCIESDGDYAPYPPCVDILLFKDDDHPVPTITKEELLMLQLASPPSPKHHH